MNHCDGAARQPRHVSFDHSIYPPSTLLHSSSLISELFLTDTFYESSCKLPSSILHSFLNFVFVTQLMNNYCDGKARSVPPCKLRPCHFFIYIKYFYCHIQILYWIITICSPANPPSVPNSAGGEVSNATKISAAAKKTNRNGYRWTNIIHIVGTEYAYLSGQNIQL